MIRPEELLDAARDGLAGGVDGADGGVCAARVSLDVQRPACGRTLRRIVGHRTGSKVTLLDANGYMIHNIWQVARSDTVRFVANAQHAFEIGQQPDKTMFIEMDAVPR